MMNPQDHSPTLELVMLSNIVTSVNGSAGFRSPTVKAGPIGFEKQPLRFWTSMRFDGCGRLWNDLLHPNPNHKRNFAPGML